MAEIVVNSEVTPSKSIGVVVLNYLNYDATSRCISSLLACDPRAAYIVVVDNFSPNESLVTLKNRFDGISNLEVLSSGENRGYSFGNNHGIRILRERGVDAVVIATSDTVVKTPELISVLTESLSPETGVIGPRIYENLQSINPNVEEISFKYALDIAWIQMGLPGYSLRKKARALFLSMLGKPLKPVLSPSLTAGTSNDSAYRKVYKLHGSFLCITEVYFETCGLLDEDLFMFCEEDLLAWNCFQHGLDQVFLESIVVEHEGDASLDVVSENGDSKFIENLTKVAGRKLSGKISTLSLFFHALMPKKYWHIWSDR